MQTKQTQENTKKQQKIPTTTKNNTVSKILFKEFRTVPEKNPSQNRKKSLSKTGLIIPIFIQDGLKINTYYYFTYPKNRTNILRQY